MSERAYWVAWHRLEGVGPAGIKRLWEHFGALETAWHAREDQLAQAQFWSEQKARRLGKRQADPLEMLARWEAQVPPFWTPADPDYPPLLREIPDPPPILFWQGALRAWPPAVAVVGTRQPSAHGSRWAWLIGKALAEAGFLVVSGLAMGIDGLAHRAALDTDGLTAAVLGGSLQEIYPSSHRPLAEQIAETGILLSEYLPGTPVEATNFPRRNRIVAGICQATIVVEAPERSGALITAQLACDYNRDVYVLPASLDTPEAHGGLKLISQGARPILGIEDLLVELLGDELVRTVRPPGVAIQFDGEEQGIWDCLEAGSLSFDELLPRTGLETGTLAGNLLSLEIKGLIIQEAGFRYARA